jgi:hypothetical protein
MRKPTFMYGPTLRAKAVQDHFAMGDHQLESVLEDPQKISGARSVVPIGLQVFDPTFLIRDPLLGFGNVTVGLCQVGSLHFLVHGNCFRPKRGWQAPLDSSAVSAAGANDSLATRSQASFR